jgi:hypothetical protein
MGRKYYQTFVVRSVFEFPIDMLRYDEAFPATEQDSGKIHRSIVDHDRSELIQVARFVENKSSMPTIERWQSFGCKITDIEVR